MALNPNALCTVASVKAFSSFTADATIEEAINAFSQAAERYCNRVFRSVQVTTGSPESYKGNGRRELYLRRSPITAVERVRINEQEITDYTIPEPEAGYLYRRNGWPLECAVHADLTNDPDPSERFWNIDVAYTAGFTDIPAQAADLRLACIQEVIRVLTNPNPGLSSEKTPGGHDQAWRDVRWGAEGYSIPFLPETIAILNGYKRDWV